MGTRNLTIVVSNKKYKVAQYCQWDGYLRGQGKTVANFIENEMDFDKFKNKIDALEELSEKEYESTWLDAGATLDQIKNGVGNEIHNTWNKMFPWLSRGHGAEILKTIQDKNIKINNALDFAAESLFCEWAYLLDLDEKILEIYRGFNQEPLVESDRFNFLPLAKDNSQYYQIKLFKKIPFSEVTVALVGGLDE